MEVEVVLADDEAEVKEEAVMVNESCRRSICIPIVQILVGALTVQA